MLWGGVIVGLIVGGLVMYGVWKLIRSLEDQ
jgi:high-affinity Fe2+/Pb2+ permease